MDRQDFRMALRPGRARVNMQFTEIATESFVRVRVHRLVAKEQDLVFGER